jgi:signal transduction histidine kinase
MKRRRSSGGPGGPPEYELAEDASLRERRRFETMLTRLLMDFTDPGREVDALIHQWLGHVGECRGTDQVAIYRLHQHTGDYERTHSWHADSRKPLPGTINPSTYVGPHALGQVREPQMVRFDSIEDLPAGAERDRQQFRALGIYAGLAIPFNIDGTPCYLVLSAGSHLHRWTDGTVHDLSLIAEVFAQAVARRRAEISLGEVAGRLINAQEAERRRIGRELHDHIGPLMALLGLTVEELRNSSFDSVSAMRHNTRKLRQQIVEVSKELHGLSHQLHSATLEAQGLVPALRRLVTEVSERHDVLIGFSQNAVPSSVASDVALCLYRVAEESLNNVVKHSRARSAVVALKGRPNEIMLTVHDHGAGFDPEAHQARTGLGLVSMRERLRLVLGTMQIESAPAHGTKVMVKVPTGA